MAVVTFVWATSRDIELYLGEWSWLDDTIEVSLHGNLYEPSTSDLTQADLSDELSGTGYTRKTLTGKTYEEGDSEFEATLTADETFWTGLNAGEARTAVLSLSTGEVLGYLPLRDANGNTDLTSTGGGGRITWRLTVAPPPPPPVGGWGATSASEGLAVGMDSPTSTKLTAWETYTGQTSRAYHSFVGDIQGPRSNHESSMANLLSTSHFMHSRGIIHLLSLRPLIKPARLKNADGTYAETQQQAYTRTGNTFSNVRAGGHDAHYREMGRIIAASGKDTRFSDGRPKLALQFGQETNLTSFPWFLGNDPAGYKYMVERYVLCMQAGTTGSINFDTWTYGTGTSTSGVAGQAPNGIDLAGVDIVFNINSKGNTTRANILAAFPDPTTVFTMDWYDFQTGTQYSDGTVTEADRVAVFNARSGNVDPTKDTVVGGYWMLQVAKDKDIYCGLDEWGLSTTEVPPAEVYNVGGGDNPTYITMKHAFLETIAESGRLAWAAYFNYDVASTGLYHKITGGKYPHTNASAKLVELF